MATRGIITIMAIILGLIAPAAWAARHLPEERGKTLFEDRLAFGGETACNSCHPGGRGLEQAGNKTRFRVMGRTQNSLEEAVNVCIVSANRGKAIAVDSAEMKDIVAYIKTLAAKKPASPGYGAPTPAPGYGAPPAAPGYGAPSPGYGR